MDTAKPNNHRNSNRQFYFFPFLVIGFAFAVSVGVTSCFDSGSDSTQLDSETSKAGSGVSSTAPSNHTENVSGFLHAPGKYEPYSFWCTACHGQDLEGDLGPSCYTCHQQVWTETTPPSSGGRISNAPPNHTDSIRGFLHALGKYTPYTKWCTACHGQALEGDVGPSCTACHGVIWTETTPPVSGGRTSNAPSNHTDNVGDFLHAPGKDTPFTSFCSACHGSNLTGGTGPSCFACHGQLWTETTPPSSGGTGGGSGGTLDGQALYNSNCSACHADGSAIVNNTASGITNAMNTLAVMTSINLTAEEIQAIADYLTGNTGGTGGGTGGGDTGGGDTGGGTGGTLDGQALYTANCSACHADGSAIVNNTASGITDAINTLGIMNGVNLTAEEIQAIADYLTGNTGGTGGGTGGGDTGGGTGGTLDGQALYTANCSACHADGSAIVNNTASGITDAINTLGIMNGINLTAEEIQAIADYLTGNTGGGTGGGGDTGGGTSGPPASHSNPEDGILHAPGNNTPYSSGCTACHGTTLEGAIGPSCFACHGEEWNESAPSGGGDGGSTGGGSTDGQALYTTYCSACHGTTGSGINGRTVDQISAAISAVPTMNSIALSLTELQAISDYLLGATGGGSTGGGTGGGSGTIDGQAIYIASCSACHGDGSAIVNNTASGITNAINTLGIMNGVNLTAEEIQAVADYLTGNTGGTGGGTGGGDTGGGGSLPANHTNSEQGILHADGNNTPYSSGCTACHGATLEGAAGPSCFACHGVEWTESAPTGGGDTGGTGGGTGGTLDGQALYTANCAACHGATGSSINGKSTSAINSAITGIGSMNNISLSTAEVQAISDYLTGNTGGTGGGTGGDTGGGDTGGTPASHTNPEDGILHAPGNNTPYTSGCTACHGTTLQGGVGPSCFACHGQEWSESAPSGGDGGSTGGGSTGGGTTTTDGQALYSTHCAACHGATGSGINGRTASAISSAITNIGSMNNISLTSTEIQAISDYLTGSTGGGSTGGGSTGGGDTGGAPTSHTDSEEGVLHAPGNNFPFTNGCTACHGSSLQGAVGPSCYSCHGQEWLESGGSSDGGGSSEEEEED